MSHWLKSGIVFLCICTFFVFTVSSPVRAQSQNDVTVYDLIALVNNGRAANGLPALNVNSILMSTAQGTAETMAANLMTWHIGDVRGRVAAAGYGGGATVWATENFAIGPMSIDDIAWIWSDSTHMLPMMTASYKDIGAGIATASDGSVYYIIQAAYTGSGSSSPSSPTRTLAPGETQEPTEVAISEYIVPVSLSTPGPDGKIIHEVQAGQSLWSIAIAYGVKIVDILRYNGLSADDQTVYQGQKLVIPSAASGANGASASGSLTPALTPTAPATGSPEASMSPTGVTPRPSATSRATAAALQAPAQDTPKPTLAATPTPVNISQSLAAGVASPQVNRLVWGILIGIFVLGALLMIFGWVSRKRRA